MPRFFRPSLDYLALLALPAALLWQQLFGGATLIPLDLLPVMGPWMHAIRDAPPVYAPLLDPIQHFYPYRAFFQEQVLAGELPLWNPYVWLGTPFVATQHGAVFYLPAWLLAGIPTEAMFAWSGWLHLFIAGAGMYLLLRELGLGRPAALAGGAAFQLNGFSIVWLSYLTVSQWTFTWLPLCAFFWERGRRTGSLPALAGAGLCLALSFMGGHGQISLYVLLGLGPFMLYRTLQHRGETSWRAALVTLGLPAALGLGLAAAHLLPALDYLPRTHRAGEVAWAALGEKAFPLRQLVTFLVPRFFGDDPYFADAALNRPYWGHLNFIEMTAYPGAAALALAALALWRRRNPDCVGTAPGFPAAFFAALAVAAVLLAMRTPLYWPVWKFVPGLGQLDAVSRVLCLANWGIAALAALGVERVLAAEGAQRRVWLGRAGWVAAGCALAVLAAVSFEAPRPAAQDLPLGPGETLFFHPQLLGRHTLMLAAALTWPLGVVAILWLRLRAGPAPNALAGWALVALVAADLFAFGYPHNPRADRSLGRLETPELTYLMEVEEPYRFLSTGRPGPRAPLERIPPNLPALYRIPDVHGSDSLVPRRLLDYLDAIGPEAREAHFDRPEHPLMLALGVRFLYTRQEGLAASWQPVVPPRLYEQQQAFPYARLHTRARVVEPSWERGHPAPTEPSWERGHPARMSPIGTEAPTDLSRLDPWEAVLLEAPLPFDLSAGQPGYRPWRAERLGANRLRLTGAAVEPGVLVVAEGFDPGWRATANGEPLPVLPANTALLGVPVAAGTTEVVLSYEPETLHAALFITLLAAAAFCALLLAGGRVR